MAAGFWYPDEYVLGPYELLNLHSSEILLEAFRYRNPYRTPVLKLRTYI